MKGLRKLVKTSAKEVELKNLIKFNCIGAPAFATLAGSVTPEMVALAKQILTTTNGFNMNLYKYLKPIIGFMQAVGCITVGGTVVKGAIETYQKTHNPSDCFSELIGGGIVVLIILMAPKLIIDLAVGANSELDVY